MEKKAIHNIYRTWVKNAFWGVKKRRAGQQQLGGGFSANFTVVIPQ